MTPPSLAENTQAARAAGRSCPLHYHYGPEVFRQPPPAHLQSLQVLYVVGGLYGDELALQQVLRLFEAEEGRKALVFNGDFHWFDADPAVFARVQRQVLAHTALRGNVETELADEAPLGEAGCGCAYPDWVGDAVVDRSNRILQRLRTATTPALRAELAGLPMWLRAQVGSMPLGIVHGDAQSLAGWGFAQEHLREAGPREQARAWLAAAQVQAFACTHTCLPVFQSLRVPGQPAAGWILNNGAAGMPNFRGDSAGLFTRVALQPCTVAAPRLGVRHGDVYIDAVPIEVDAARAQARFLAQWPPDSDGHASYYARIAQGPDYDVQDALRQED